ncbi:MAG: hypothetical protein IKW57_01825 [Alphaproteobacteria bacterium]|nr:hypothetical protein [Alphaproteobacteria bacterium]
MKDNETAKQALNGLIEVVVFFGLMAGITTLIVKCGDKEKQRQEKLTKNEQQIAAAHRSVDSIKNIVPLLVLDSLQKHKDYHFVKQNQRKIDDLKYKNRVLTDDAFIAARHEAPNAKIRRNKKMFHQFYHIPVVKNAYWQIYMNEKEIEEFNKKKNRLEKLNTSIQNHFDSTANAQITILNQQIELLKMQNDSLANKKCR